MTRSRMQLITLVGVALLLVAACMGGADPTPTMSTTPATPTTAAASPSPQGQATPSGTPRADGCTPVLAAGETPTPTPRVDRRLGPPVMVLIAGECEQEGSIGSFFWQLAGDVAADVNAPGLQIQKDGSLVLEQGQEARFEPRVGPVPETLTMDIYPEQGNVRPLEELPNPEGTPYIGTPIPGSDTPDVFKPTTEPVATIELPIDSLTWTVDLEPGRYFLHLKGQWPNPTGEGREMTGEYSFYVRVA